MERVLIVLAKAPVPGRVKTRLCPPATPRQAAALAAAALADTLAAARRVPVTRIVVALDGEPDAALRDVTVIPQRGGALGERIAAAHADVARLVPGACTVQVGMDTPQLDPDVLDRCLDAVGRADGPDAVLGPATDGGWWALGLRDPRWADLLRDVATSRADTGDRTRAALAAAGLRVAAVPELTDVDTMVDAHAVAQACPGSRFAALLAAVGA